MTTAPGRCRGLSQECSVSRPAGLWQTTVSCAAIKKFPPRVLAQSPEFTQFINRPPFDSHSSFLNDQTNFSLTSSSNENIFRISKFYEHYKSRKIKLRLEKEYDTIKTDDLFLLFDLPSSQNERIFPPVEIGNETVRINRFGSETN